MKLSCQQDVDAPADFVLAQITDFEGWERAAMRRGVDVARTDTLARPGPGMEWASTFRYRGRDRRVTVRVDRVTAEGQVGFVITAATADGTLNVEVLAMAASRARMLISVEVKPKTFAAKLFVQSLRLARARVERKLAQRARMLADEIEARHRGKAKLASL